MLQLQKAQQGLLFLAMVMLPDFPATEQSLSCLLSLGIITIQLLIKLLGQIYLAQRFLFYSLLQNTLWGCLFLLLIKNVSSNP